MTGNETPDLAHLQRWMSFTVQHRQTADTAIDETVADALVPATAVRAGQVVTPGDQMTPTERLQIYNGSYFARLKEVILGDHQWMKPLLGSEVTHEALLDFVHTYPSRHPNLNRFAKELPEFLARWQGDLPHRALAVDLATIGVAVQDAFDAPEFTPFDMTALHHLQPEEWESVRFTPNPSLRLLELAHPSHVFFQASLNEQAAVIPEPVTQNLAVYRHDHQVWRVPLPRPAYAILTALAANEPFGRALARGEDLGDQVGRWFQEWSHGGLFVSAQV